MKKKNVRAAKIRKVLAAKKRLVQVDRELERQVMELPSSVKVFFLEAEQEYLVSAIKMLEGTMNEKDRELADLFNN